MTMRTRFAPAHRLFAHRRGFALLSSIGCWSNATAGNSCCAIDDTDAERQQDRSLQPIL